MLEGMNHAEHEYRLSLPRNRKMFAYLLQSLILEEGSVCSHRKITNVSYIRKLFPLKKLFGCMVFQDHSLRSNVEFMSYFWMTLKNGKKYSLVLHYQPWTDGPKQYWFESGDLDVWLIIMY